MAGGPERYLAKAQECLASAGADFAAGRYNSVANRAYYASFQAAVAILLASGLRPRDGSWQHRFVQSQFSGKLVMRRKGIPAVFTGTLALLLEARVVADYQEQAIGRPAARTLLRDSSALVAVVMDRVAKGDKVW